MKYLPAIRWVIALKSEANPIIKNLGMSPVKKGTAYPTYKDTTGSHWLTISGVGYTAAAAASAHLHEKSQAPSWASWINIGIAGCGHGNYGTLYMVDKIYCETKARCEYPGVAVSTSLPRTSLLTVNQPKSDYTDQNLIDMEGYSFYATVSKFSCRELVVILKVVSDSPVVSLKNITPKNISELISDNMDNILSVVSKLEKLSELEFKRQAPLDVCDQVIRKWHFTVSQEHQLNYLVHRWAVAFPKNDLMSELVNLESSKSVIKYLSQTLDAYEVDWRQN